MKQLIERYQTDYYKKAQFKARPVGPARLRADNVNAKMDDLTFSARRASAATSSRTAEPADLETRFRGLVQSPLRAGILRYLSARPEESFDVESLMQTFGRLRMDVENCVRELATSASRSPSGAVRSGISPRVRRTRRSPICSTHFLERRAAVSTEDQSPSVQRFREMIGSDEKMLIVFEWIRTAAKSDISVLILGPTGSGKEVVARMIHELSRAQRRELPGRQLRRAARHAVRVGNLRLREGRVHRRARPQAGPPRARQRRHAVPRRDRRHVAHRAGEAVARARGAPLRAPRRQQVDLGRFPADLGDQPPARAVRARRTLPRGPVLPRQRVRHPAAVAARAPGGHSRARPALPRAVLRGAGLPLDSKAFSREALDLLVTYHWPGNIRELESTVSRAALSAPGRIIRATDIEFLHANTPTPLPIAAIGCPRSPKPSARTSSGCSKPRSGTRRKPPACSTSAAARCTGRSWSTSSNRSTRPAGRRAAKAVGVSRACFTSGIIGSGHSKLPPAGRLVKELPLAARLYVSGRLIAGAAFFVYFFPRTIAHPASSLPCCSARRWRRR